MLSPQTLQKLQRFDTPTICNLIELFDVRPRNTGYMDARIMAAFPELPPIVGFAATATFRSGAPPGSGDAYGDLGQQVERFAALTGPPIVVFQDLDDPAAAATFGEVMCTVYQAFGAVGLITSGAGRDLEQVRAIGFPGLHQRHHLFPWLQPYSPDSCARTGWRVDRLPRRSAPRRSQRRHHCPDRNCRRNG